MIGTNHDIDVNQTDRYERTPLYCATLYCASENGHTEVRNAISPKFNFTVKFIFYLFTKPTRTC